jgi:UDP-N-acetylglucosamine--N-acetylmuramyl-(pentapeptide) pyrophosphoryl-undecaprenol N-acetylglucosamine transferase
LKEHRTYRVILSGGGTGGHIFPAVAIANELRAIDPTMEILFVGAIGKMEMDKVPRSGYKIIGLPVSAFHRGFSTKNFLFPFRLIASMIKASRVIRQFKPDLVIGTGGFASGPVLRVAARKGIATMIQEQNSFPGVTNRLLARKVNRICVAYPRMEHWFPAEKTEFTGNPVRLDLRVPESKLPEARAHFHITSDFPVILVFGGSQGARTLNRSLLNHLDELAKSQVEIIWQTGTSFYAGAKSEVESKGYSNIKVYEFIHEMNFAYALAGLVVCRSGAITLSELSLLGKPAILVPLPSAAENHQAKNANAYINGGAAVLVVDTDAQDLLVDTMLSLIANRPRLNEMASNMARFARPDAVHDIALEAFRLLSPADKHPKSENFNPLPQ